MKKDISGTILFFFQEAEELFVGAELIINAGGLEGVDGTFTMHVQQPAGESESVMKKRE